MERFLRHYLLAVQFATRVPVRSALASLPGEAPDLLRASAPHLPGVGWLVGIAACVAFAIVSLALPEAAFTPLAAAVGCTIATMLLTGGTHERSVNQLTGETLALTMLLLGKVSLVAVLASRSPAAVLTALLAAHTVSRFWPLVLMHTVPPVQGMVDIGGPPIDGRVDRRAIGIGALWCAVPLALMVLAHGVLFALLALITSAAAFWGLQRWLNRSGGLSSTSLGAAQQVCEVSFYLGAGFGLF